MIEITDVDALKEHPGDIKEAFEIILWSISAANEGKIERSNLRFNFTAPYLSYDRNVITNQSTKEYLEHFDKLLEIAINPPNVATLFYDMDDLYEAKT